VTSSSTRFLNSFNVLTGGTVSRATTAPVAGGDVAAVILVPSFIEFELRFSSIAEELTTSRVMGFSMSKVPGGGSDVVAVVGAAVHTIGMPAPSGFFPHLLGGRSCSPPLAASTIPGQEEIAARLVLISEREDMPAPSRGVTREKCCRREETRDASGITEASRHKP